MQRPISQLAEIVEIDSQKVTILDKDNSIKLKHTCCSTSLTSLNLLATGEWGNPIPESRNALVTFTDLRTGHVKGDFNLFPLIRVDINMD